MNYIEYQNSFYIYWWRKNLIYTIKIKFYCYVLKNIKKVYTTLIQNKVNVKVST